jgi:hypothetical protein
LNIDCGGFITVFLESIHFVDFIQNGTVAEDDCEHGKSVHEYEAEEIVYKLRSFRAEAVERYTLFVPCEHRVPLHMKDVRLK